MPGRDAIAVNSLAVHCITTRLSGCVADMHCVGMQEYVNKLAVMLLEARGNDHSPVQAQIDNLVNECSAMCASLAMSNPSAMRTLHCSNFDGALMVQQGPSSSKWLSISVSPFL